MKNTLLDLSRPMFVLALLSACGGPAEEDAETSAAVASSPSVSQGTLTPVLSCGGVGSTNTSLGCCAGLVAVDGVCRRACTTDSGCAANEFCGHTGGVYWCKPDRRDGEACERDAVCKGGSCIDFEDGAGAVCTSPCGACNGTWSGGRCSPTFQGRSWCYKNRGNAETCAYGWHCQTGDCGKDPYSNARYCAANAPGQRGRFVNVSAVWCGGSCSEGHDSKECTCTWSGDPSQRSSYYGATGLGCNEYACCDAAGNPAYAWVNWAPGQCTSQNEALGILWLPQHCNADDQTPWNHTSSHEDIVCW